MEYYQGIQYIAQKNINQIENIIKFENYDTLIKSNGDYLIVFKQNECVCLQELIESIKNNYVKISIGQAIIISNRILNHVKQLFDIQKTTHGKLLTKNIYISLDPKSNKFNIVNPFLEIKKIHFVDYQSHYSIIKKEDQKHIKVAIINLLSLYQENNKIKDLISLLNKEDTFKYFIQQLVSFEKQFVDINKQQLDAQDLILNYEKRKMSLEYIERFYQKLYIDYQCKLKEYWSNQNKDKILNSQKEYSGPDSLFKNIIYQICNLIFFPIQKSIIGLFQIEISQILDSNNQDNQLERIFQYIYQQQNQKIKELNYFIEIIPQQIDFFFKEQLSLQEKCNLKFNFLTKEQIASEYHKLLAFELSKNNCTEIDQSKEILDIIQISLFQNVKLYRDNELKIQLIEFLNDMI